MSSELRASLILFLALSQLPAAAVPQSVEVQPEPERPAVVRRLDVTNSTGQARAEVVRASVPFAQGEVRDARGFDVDGAAVHAVPMMRWRDGSVAVAQLHLPVRLAGKETRTLEVTPLAPGRAPAAATGAWPTTPTTRL